VTRDTDSAVVIQLRTSARTAPVGVSCRACLLKRVGTRAVVNIESIGRQYTFWAVAACVPRARWVEVIYS